MSEVRSTKPSPLIQLPLPLLLGKWGRGGGEDVAAAARLAMGSGSVSGEYLGKGTPWGTTNPS